MRAFATVVLFLCVQYAVVKRLKCRHTVSVVVCSTLLLWDVITLATTDLVCIVHTAFLVVHANARMPRKGPFIHSRF